MALLKNAARETQVTAQARYTKLETDRSFYINRAEVAAKYTIPALFPPGGTKQSLLHVTYQSVGSRGVNNLAAKLLLALFPPGGAFFRLALDEYLLDSLASDPQQRSELEAALAKVERSVMKRFEASSARATISQALKHLIVTGNGMLQVLPQGRLKFHSLRDFVVKRDLEGTPIEMIVRETLARETLPEDILAQLPQEGGEKTEDEIDVYTYLHRGARGRWSVFQEVGGVEVPGSRGSFPAGKCPYLPLRFVAVDGEDYGRGYVDEYLGDLTSADSLNGSIVDLAAISARVLFLVNESGLTSKKDLQDAPNGGIVDGNKDDITILQLEKYADFGVAKDVVARIEGRLEQAFLLASSIQRQAERVTAEEIRIMAGELEQTLGGIYSVLAQELQLPLVANLMAQLQREGKLPTLPEKTVSPQIVTGLEGLGRNTDLARMEALMALAASLGTAVGPENVGRYLNVGAFLKQGATALSINAEGLVRSEDEVQQSVQQEQAVELAGKIAPTGMKIGADMAGQPAA
jgi:hypothetical protein